MDKVLSIISSLLSSSSPILYIACLAIGAFGGWYITSDHYQAVIQKTNAELSKAATQEIEDYARRLSEASNALVSANLNNRRLADANAGLRDRLLVANNREDERVKANPERSYRTEYASCRRLLVEGVELLHEGDELVRELATNKDALAKLAK